MNQVKIGTFIASRRKEQGFTQIQLAEKLGITDRAVSKWETGKSLPDASIMLELCELLKITVNDLLSGEILSMDNYNEKMEKNLLELAKEKERADRRLLSLEIVISIISLLSLTAMIAAAKILLDQSYVLYGTLLIILGMLQFIIAMLFCLRIEQVAGYYECQKCGHKYIPKYISVNVAMHLGRTRFMKCPECGKWSWQKKVINKDD